jgi:stage II sporulation protein D
VQWQGNARLLTVVALSLIMASCARHRRPPTETTPPLVFPSAITAVRVAIAAGAPEARIAGTSLITMLDGATGAILRTGGTGTVWTVRPSGGGGLELTGPGMDPIVVRSASIDVRADERAGVVVSGGRRFRGSLSILRVGTSVTVVNILPVEDYLKGVVPLEIGTRSGREMAAVAAQAVAARSFTYSRVAARRRDQTRTHDLVADVSDQVYGGMDAETAAVSAQVDATRGEMLMYAGRIIEAVYSSSCGGQTAAADEVWQGGGAPYLRSVSDSIPGGRGPYCGIAPSFEWTTSIDRSTLVSGLDTYLRVYGTVNGPIDWVDSVRAGPRSASGRVSAVRIGTNAGQHEVTGDRIRFVLRAPGGQILRSTMFDVNPIEETGAGVVRLELRGRGYGHGVGMCQWGAIGRARTGADYREILGAYYPGVTITRGGRR